jgi:hypothetical protein
MDANVTSTKTSGIDINIPVNAKKCINLKGLKRLLCCNSKCLEEDTVIMNCCVVQNITNGELCSAGGLRPPTEGLVTGVVSPAENQAPTPLPAER